MYLLWVLAACGDNAVPDHPGTPTAVILEPADSTIVTTSPIDVKIRVADDRGIANIALSAGSVSVVLDPAMLDASGEAVVTLTLDEGIHDLRLAVEDLEGLSAEHRRQVTLDLAPPQAEILSPASATVVADSALDVRVRVRDTIGLASAALSIGDAEQPIDLATLDDAGETTLTITVPAGVSQLVLAATDLAGRTADRSVEVRLDESAPSIEVLAPRAGASETRRLLFARLVDDAGIASARAIVNGGTPLDLPVTGAPISFELRATLPLRAGPNEVVLETTDIAGRTSTQTIAFRYGHAVTAGGAHSGAIIDGGLQVWGRYNVGQLGLGGAVGDAESRLAPERVPAFGATATTVAAIAFNQNTSLAIRSDGTVWTWGANGDGQLGHGDAVQRNVPAQIAELAAIYAHAGYSHVLAIRSDGTVISWGRNASGQIGVDGNGTSTDDQLVPVEIGFPVDVVEVAGGSEHSVALGVDGRVFVWGRNTYGNLGNGTADADRHFTPTAVPGITNAIDIATGRDHVLVLRSDGSVVAWGLGSSGQLGYGENTDPAGEDRFAPVVVVADAAGTPLANVRAVTANGNTSYALVAGARLQYVGWGQNFSGQLATGETTSEEWFARRAVVYTPGSPPTYLDEVVDLAAIGTGITHTIVMTPSGDVHSWGWNFRGSLGVPAIANAWAQTIAVQVTLAP